MKDNILLSIGIPNYNYEKYIGVTIQSVVNQLGQDLEILISDNASTDNSWKIIDGFNDARIRKWRQTENLGLIKNWDFLLNNARGKYFLLLPSDDLLDKDFLTIFKQKVINVNEEISTILWGYQSFNKELVNLTEEIIKPFSKNIPNSFCPKLEPNLLIEATLFSPPWCHAQNTLLKKKAGGYKLNTYRSDTRSFIDTIIGSMNSHIISINECLAYQRNHDTNVRNIAKFDLLFNDNITIADELIKVNTNVIVKSRLTEWKRQTYSKAISFSFKSIGDRKNKEGRISLYKIINKRKIWNEFFFWGILYSFYLIAFKYCGRFDFVNKRKEYLNL